MKQQKCRVHLLIILVVALITTMCSSSEKQKKVNELSQKLQALVDSMIDVETEDPIHNAVLLVECPKIKWKGAAGMADGKKEAMTADHKIKIASIGKTFTATVVLQLIEEGYLNLDDTIDKFLDNPIVKLDSLHIYEGIAYGRQITIKQLLSHTSGIADYMEDPRFIPDVIEHPQTSWSPSKILGKYYEYQTNEKTLFPPGEDFNYSDVNYVLLAMIIEHVTGATLQSQLKTRIFDRLGMKNSYLEYYEKPRGNKPLSHAYLSTIDLVTDINTSMDWGGGGIVSTCEELNTFFRALVDGKLFKKESTLRQMLAAADEGRGGIDYDYGLGIMKRSLHSLTFYGHGGAYDCDVFYCPEKNISVCMSLNQMNTHGKRDKFLLQAIKLIL
ncbi:MAG: beta-lactamase family protein [candidate division WOR-3 bacterium]|nr:MAG: beta-lactamase family protein [candidate division WOR-3 bacterium]